MPVKRGVEPATENPKWEEKTQNLEENLWKSGDHMEWFCFSWGRKLLAIPRSATVTQRQYEYPQSLLLYFSFLQEFPSRGTLLYLQYLKSVSFSIHPVHLLLYTYVSAKLPQVLFCHHFFKLVKWFLCLCLHDLSFKYYTKDYSCFPLDCLPQFCGGTMEIIMKFNCLKPARIRDTFQILMKKCLNGELNHL